MLRSRWLYIALLMVVVGLYVRAWRHPSPQADETSAMMSEPAEKASAALRRFDVSPAELIQRASQRPKLAFLLSLWGAVACLLLVGGVVCNLRVRRARRRKAAAAHPPASVWTGGEAARILLLLILLAALLPFARLAAAAVHLPAVLDLHVWSLGGMFLLYGMLLVIMWAFAADKSLPIGRIFGLSSRLGGALKDGFTVYLTAFPWVFGLLWLVAAISRLLGIEPPIEPIHELLFLEPRAWVVGLTVALACVAGPVAEELLFRSLLFGTLRRRWSLPISMLISSALFAALHANPIGFIPIAALGCVLAYLYERTGSLAASIAVHVAHNTLLVGVGLTVKALLA